MSGWPDNEFVHINIIWLLDGISYGTSDSRRRNYMATILIHHILSRCFVRNALGKFGFRYYDAALRLVRLLDAPQDIPVLAPYAVREIIYRVLHNEQGDVRNSLAASDMITSGGDHVCFVLLFYPPVNFI